MVETIWETHFSEFCDENLTTSKKIYPILTKLLPYTDEYLGNNSLNFYKNILSVTMILSQVSMVAFLMALSVSTITQFSFSFLFAAADTDIQGRNHQPLTYDQYDSNALPYKSYDYGQGSDYYEESVKEIECYSCTYHVRQGTAAGQDNCRDPFVQSGIVVQKCRGPCMVSTSCILKD